MKVLFLPFYGPEGPSSRVRVYQYLRPLRDRGFEVGVVRPVGGKVGLGRIGYLLAALARSARADVVVLQKQTLTAGIGLLAAVNPRLVYDIDDAVFARPAWEQSPDPRGSARVANTIGRCRAVIAGNRYLAGYAREFCPDVTVIPTGVDLSSLPDPGPGRSESGVTVGWTGTRENLWYLRQIREIFPRLQRKFGQEIRFQIISNGSLEISGASVEHVPWSLKEEYRNLSRLDVGLAPLGDDPWSRGKCGFKAIQYMSLGIPPVASRAGVHPEIISDGETGFLARDLDEWEEKVSCLVRDRGMRERIGRAAREKVARSFSLESNLPRLIEVLERVARG